MRKGRKAGNKGIVSRPRTQTPMELDKSYDGIRWIPKHTHPIPVHTGAKQFKSVWRAMRRSDVTNKGIVLPSRPFNNGKRTRGRKLQADFQKVYESMKNAKH